MGPGVAWPAGSGPRGMTPEPELEPGERLIATWPARALSTPGARPVSGSLQLTDRRLLFLGKSGLFGRSRSPAHDRSVPLERIGGADPHPFELPIGYGDRMVLAGIDIAGSTYELGREASSMRVLEQIASARELRRRGLGLPDDVQSCSSCGRWVAKGTPVCAKCARSQPSLR